MKTWDERLFELIKMGDGFVVCKGGTGTLAELAVLWEMQNKAVISRKPIVALGDFWAPILSRVREVEVATNRNVATPWAESAGPLIAIADTARVAADYLEESLGKS
jgi:predicted Rossmann-fold nucleotide-binding protein